MPDKTVCTDAFGRYRHLDTSGYDHKTVSHKGGEYVNAQGRGD